MIVAGVILLAVAVGAFFVARSQRKRLGALASTATVACNAVTADETCEVVGEAQAGPGGQLKGPASGRPCVWHRQKVTHHWEEWERDSDGDRRRENHSRVVSDQSSHEVFAVRDQTGQVLVNPQDAKIDDPVKSHDVRSDRRSASGGVIGALLDGLDSRTDEEIEVEEWIVPAGQRLYVRGTPSRFDAGLVMTKPADGHFLISTRSEEELAGSAKTWSIVAAAVAGLCAVGGVVLIVVGAVS